MDDLLKDAIADAKAVRETALENAKIALEEAFTPRLQSMLSKKIQSEIEVDEGEHEDDEVEEGEHEDDEVEERGQMKRDGDEIEDEGIHVGEMIRDGDEIEDEGEDEKDEGIIEIDGVKYAPVVSEEEHEDDEKEDDMEEELDLESVIKELETEIAESEETDEESVNEGEHEDDEDEKKDESVNEEEELEEEEEIDEQSTSSGIGKGTGVKMASASDEEDPGKGKIKESVEAMQNELNEYKEAVTFLREKLHEVNILNAKLLYTNRLFKEYVLSNDQKMKVVETFDRAQTTREIKLVYSTLAESFNDRETIKKNSIKESASQKTGTTAPKKKIISEEDNVANRFKKLAGILKD